MEMHLLAWFALVQFLKAEHLFTDYDDYGETYLDTALVHAGVYYIGRAEYEVKGQPQVFAIFSYNLYAISGVIGTYGNRYTDSAHWRCSSDMAYRNISDWLYPTFDDSKWVTPTLIEKNDGLGIFSRTRPQVTEAAHWIWGDDMRAQPFIRSYAFCRTVLPPTATSPGLLSARHYEEHFPQTANGSLHAQQAGMTMLGCASKCLSIGQCLCLRSYKTGDRKCMPHMDNACCSFYHMGSQCYLYSSWDPDAIRKESKFFRMVP